MTAQPPHIGPRRPDGPDAAEPEVPRGSWPWAIAGLVLGSLAVFALYWETAWSMGKMWWGSGTFGHGFLIAPISAFLIWQQRARLARVNPRPSVLGLGAAALGALAWLIGDTAGVFFVQQLAFVFVLQSLFLATLGARVTVLIAFPLLYLYFAVPFGTSLIAPLQDVTAAFVVRFLQLVGMPVYLDGIFIHIPSGSFEVAEACAGLRFLIASVALGVLFAHEFYRQLWRRALFVVLSIVVPIIANGFRATSLVFLAHYSSYELAVGTDHLTYGLIFLSFVLFCLLGLGFIFREPYRPSEVDSEPRPQPVPIPAGATQSHPVSAVGVALIALASWAYADHIDPRSPSGPVEFAPPAFETWQAVAPTYDDWKPSFPSASQEYLMGFQDDDARVDLYVAYFAQQRQGAEVVNWHNSLTGQAPWQRAGGGGGKTNVGSETVAFNYERIIAGERGRVVRYWYWVDGRLITSPYLAKALEAKAKLLGGEQAAAVIAIAADYSDNPRTSWPAFESFLAQAWPVSRVFGRPKG